MKKYIETVNTMMESFPYIQEFHGKTIVIKYGGHAMQSAQMMLSFAKDMVLLKYVGINPVIVHGGGPQIGELLKQLGRESNFVDGLRVTDSSTMDVVEMVLMGKVNKEIVNVINGIGGKAVGLCGKDGSLFSAEKIFHNAGEKKLDIGQVGTVKSVNPAIIEALEKDKFIPVIAPIGSDNKGVTYNINADIAAGKIAGALKAEKLVLLTDVEGVKIKGKMLPSIKRTDAKKLIKQKEISRGMIPKVNCCLDALADGVKKAHIIDGRVEHSVLLELFTNAGIGTEIIN